MRSTARCLAVAGVMVCAASCASGPGSTLTVPLAAALTLGHPSADSLRNANGSPRVTNVAEFEVVMKRIAPVLNDVGRDVRLQLDPNLIAALLFKESGGDSLAVSTAPALGLAQLTRVADAELRRITSPTKPAWPAYAWMGAEIDAWPRDPQVHGDGATVKPDTLIAHGRLTARTEYLLDPATSARAAALWLRLLIARWSDDDLPGGYAQDARASLGAGASTLSAAQLLDLAIVSYNRGAEWVRTRVVRDGSGWSRRLDDGTPEGVEAADYLERVRAYAAIFRNSGSGFRRP